MPSPLCIINGANLVNYSTIDGYDTTLSHTVYISLADTTGVSSWDLTCIAADDQIDPSSVVITQTGYSAHFTTDYSGNLRGATYILQSTINDGLDINGNTQPSYTTTFAVFAIGQSGLRLLAKNQTIEGNIQFGWVEQLNKILTTVAQNGTSYATNYGSADIITTGALAVGGLQASGSSSINSHLAGAMRYEGVVITSDNPYYQIGDTLKTSFKVTNNANGNGIILPAPINGKIINIINESDTYNLIIQGNFISGATITCPVNRSFTFIGSTSYWLPLGSY